MKTSYEMLIELKNRYHLYIMEKSFTKLMLYIGGYEKCIAELFAGKEINIIESFNFRNFVRDYFQSKDQNHNWKAILLFESHTDENAFNVFYKILDLYLKENPNVMEEEYMRQKKYHQLQLNTDLEKIEPSRDYLTSGTILEYLELKKSD